MFKKRVKSAEERREERVKLVGPGLASVSIFSRAPFTCLPLLCATR